MESYPGITVQVQCVGRGGKGEVFLSDLTSFKGESWYPKEEFQFMKTENDVFIVVHKLKDHRYEHAY